MAAVAYLLDHGSDLLFVIITLDKIPTVIAGIGINEYRVVKYAIAGLRAAPSRRRDNRRRFSGCEIIGNGRRIPARYLEFFIPESISNLVIVRFETRHDLLALYVCQ